LSPVSSVSSVSSRSVSSVAPSFAPAPAGSAAARAAQLVEGAQGGASGGERLGLVLVDVGGDAAGIEADGLNELARRPEEPGALAGLGVRLRDAEDLAVLRVRDAHLGEELGAAVERSLGAAVREATGRG